MDDSAHLQTVAILDVPVHKVTGEQALDAVDRFLAEPRLHQIATVNPEFVMTARRDRQFREILQSADLCLPDGVGLLLASRWLGDPLPQRVAGSDFVYQLAELAARNRWRLFLLGAAPGVADEAAAILSNRYPDLLVAGTYSGSPEPSQDDSIVPRVNESNADILYVAYGAPAQDKWIARNRDRLPAVRVAMGVGGSLDFIVGRSVRAPHWMRRAGLEWLHRLFREPWRWRRMLALPRFAVAVFVSRFR